MTTKKERQEILKERFQQLFVENELPDILYTTDEYKYKEIVNNQLDVEKFPDHATVDNVYYDMNVTNNQSIDEWVNDYIDENEINNNNFSQFESKGEIAQYILNKEEYLKFTVDITTDLNEFLDMHPSEEMIAKSIENKFDTTIAEQWIGELHPDYEDIFEKEAEEQGFPKVNIYELNVEYHDIKLNESAENIASAIFEEVNRLGFLDFDNTDLMERLLVEEGYVDFKPVILDDPEDFDDEYEEE